MRTTLYIIIRVEFQGKSEFIRTFNLYSLISTVKKIKMPNSEQNGITNSQ